MRRCKHCHDELIDQRADAVFCTTTCRRAEYERRRTAAVNLIYRTTSDYRAGIDPTTLLDRITLEATHTLS